MEWFGLVMEVSDTVNLCDAMGKSPHATQEVAGSIRA